MCHLKHASTHFAGRGAGFAPGGSAAEKKSLFDTLVGTFVEISEGGYSVWLNYLIVVGIDNRMLKIYGTNSCGNIISYTKVKPGADSRFIHLTVSGTITHREAELHNLSPCGSKIRDKPVAAGVDEATVSQVCLPVTGTLFHLNQPLRCIMIDNQSHFLYIRHLMTALLCVAGLAFVTSCESSSHDDDDQPTAEEQSQMLTEEQATALVFRLAGVSASEVSNLRVETDRDDGVLEYEVKFTVGNREYEYEIDAITGALRGTEIE